MSALVLARPRTGHIGLSFPLFPVPFAVLAFALRLWPGPDTTDDAYITFRYARNLAQGMGLVYNPGEHVIGTSTPLWTLLLAGLYRLGLHDLPSVALGLAALCDGLTTVLLMVVAQRFGFGRGWQALVGVLFAVNALSLHFAMSGMESSLFTLLIIAALLATIVRQPYAAAALAAAATITRLEGLLLVVLIVGCMLARRERPSWVTMLIYLVPVTAWFLFALWWSGHLLPESVLAKAADYQGRLPADVNSLIFMHTFNEPGLNMAEPTRRIADPIGRAFWIIPFLAIPCVRRLVRWASEHPTAIPFLLFGPVFAACYALASVRSVYLFPWYVVPLVPFFIVGIVALARALIRFRWLQVVAALLLVCWSLMGLTLDHGAWVAAGPPRTREPGFASAARFLLPRLNASSVVALPEIGVFGYDAPVRILDTVGLVSPESLQFYPVPMKFADGNMPEALLRRLHPDDLVLASPEMPRALPHELWFRQHYRLLRTFPLQPSPDLGRFMLVYEHLSRSASP